jgi:hypothetical protein
MRKLFLELPNAHYKIGDHVIFNRQALTICQEYEAFIEDSLLVQTYLEKVEQEESIFLWMRRSEHTEEKAEADYQRDGTINGVTGIVRINLKHFDQDVRDAARHINNLLENYGDIAHADYDSETALIDSLLVHLKSPSYLPAVMKLGLTKWISNLQELNDKFKQYVEETIQEQFEKPDITAGESRKQTDEALQNITNHIEALIILKGKENFLPFIKKFNELVEHYNNIVHEHYGRLHAQIDISNADVEPPQPMMYTGKPISVIPVVRLHKIVNNVEEIVELVFTQDFTIALKNNVNRGTAIITIQGIGKYKGQFITTFQIN